MAKRHTLRAGYADLALLIQEAADALSSNDVSCLLADALSDCERWCYLINSFGDAAKGEVIYSCGGEVFKAPYTITPGADGKAATCVVGFDAKTEVVPRTVYEPKAADEAVALEAAAREAALRNTGGLRLAESAAAFVGDVPLIEAVRASYPILMITPGTGSTAHYTKEVLKKAAADKIFKAGTFMFWNHPTRSEEAARPEGDLDNLAAITTSDGEYQENGAKGPGIYANAKPMADYAEKIGARAEHIGLSIRAGGTASGRVVDGKPELSSIDFLESVDYVTKAGRGGAALAEAAKYAGLLDDDHNLKERQTDMDTATFERLQETVTSQTALVTSQTALIEKLNRRALRGDAIELGSAFLRSTSLNEAARQHVIENVLGTVDAPREIPVKEGALDAPRLTEIFTAEAKRVGVLAAALNGGGNVRHMGSSAAAVEETADQIKTREAREARHEAIAEDSFTRLMGNAEIGKVAARGRAA